MMVTRILSSASLVLAMSSAAHAAPVRRCVEESEKLVGRRAVVVDKNFPAPRKVRHVEPEFPTRAGSTTVGSGNWLGDALVDQEGTVSAVWTLRPLRFDPPWPEFEEAIAAGIRQWTYEPARVDGQSVPVCVTVSVSINWR